MYFCVDEFEVGVSDSTFCGNEQQKVLLQFQNHFLNFVTSSQVCLLFWSNYQYKAMTNMDMASMVIDEKLFH